MKTNRLFTKLIFGILLLTGVLLTPTTHAQTELWGMTGEGGDYNAGVIFKTDENGNNQSVQHSFYKVLGRKPQYTHLCEATNGKFYGMTEWGGIHEKGVIFEFNPIDNTYTAIFNFDVTNGAHPHGSLMQASNGLLYGMTFDGGINSEGVLFSFNITTNSFNKILDFDNSNGEEPYGDLIEADNGKLYGMTYRGGLGGGVIFEYDPSTEIFTKKIDFDNSTSGYRPKGSLIQANNGLIYGTTHYGNNLFEYNLTTNTVTNLKTFGGTDGSSPIGSLLQASNNKLYGLCESGASNSYGVLFEYDIVSGNYNVKHDFSSGSGIRPGSSLIEVGADKLYGVTQYYGYNTYDHFYYGGGTIFEFDLNTDTYSVIQSLNTNLGQRPRGGLTLGSDGNIYGLASEEGVANGGTIFSYDLTNNVCTKKIDFGHAPTGYYLRNIIQADNGKLYGIGSGGTYNKGVFFEFNPINNVLININHFAGNNGQSPIGRLVQASDGNIYGVTKFKPSYWNNGSGVIYKYDPGNETYELVVDFNNEPGVYQPEGGLVEAGSGKLFGTSNNSSYGNIYEYDINNNIVSSVYNFNYTDGSNPKGELLYASDGFIYGTTYDGGQYNRGVLFKLDPSNYTYTKLIDFEYSATGGNSHCGLIEASNNLIYGVNVTGGANGEGTLYEFNPSDGALEVKADFDDVNLGKYPYGTLVQSSNGKLYGLTQLGGINEQGTLYEYDIITETLSKKIDFNVSNGSDPYKNQLVKIVIGSNWTGTNSSDWTDAGNWEFDEVPNPVMDVTIPPTYMNPPIVDQEAVAHDLTIDGGNLQIIEGGGLTLTGDLNNEGFLEVKSNILGNGSFIDNGTITGSGSYSIERFMDFDGWHLIGSPISNGTANMFLGMYLQSYSEPGVAWVDITDENTPLDPGTGYALWHDAGVFGDTYYFYGDPNTGNVTMPVSADNTYGWNLLSNPYPSAIDWDLVDKSQINGAIYYYDAGAMDYVSYNGGMGGGTQYIPPGQGFFVSAPTAGTLSFDNSVRTHNGSGSYYKSANTFNNYIELEASGNGFSDKAYMRFTNEATAIFDGDYDAFKLYTFTEEVPQVYFIVGDDHLSINCLPETTSVEVGFKAGTAGEYTISLDEITDIPHAVLEDKLNGQQTDLMQTAYTFQYSLIDMEERFILHFTPLSVEETAESNMQVYTSGQTLYINSPDEIGQANAKILDVTGRTMEVFELNHTTGFSKPLSLPTGYYLVSIQTGTEIITKKVFIK